MIADRKLTVVLPAFNAERTLARTAAAIPRDVVDEVLLVDDASADATIAVARRLGIPAWRHETTRGYGGNQKTCYRMALARGADIVVMLHPDDQYDPSAIPSLAALIASGRCDVALASRVLDGAAVRRGMPPYKHACNRAWTWLQNRALGLRLSEYHTGFRAYSREFLSRVPLLENSDDFVFDNQVLVQAVHFGYRIAEIFAPAWFREDSSSISPWRGVRYGLGVLGVTAQYRLQRAGLVRLGRFDPQGHGLTAAWPAAGVPVDALAG